MKRFAVFGLPIIHSLSPNIYTQLFEKNNFNAKYNRVATNKPEDVIYFINEFNLAGANITTPLKQKIIPFCSSITDDAKTINAVNTIKRHNDKLFGFNTDWEGVLNTLREYLLPQTVPQNLTEKQTKILIIGAGSAAAAAVFGLTKFYPTSNIAIVNRTINKAKQLSQKFGVNYLDKSYISPSELENYDIVLFTIPLQNSYYYNAFINDIEKFPNTVLIFFASYADFDIFNECKKNNKRIVTGIEWLKHQAVPAFEYFYENDDFCRNIELNEAEELDVFQPQKRAWTNGVWERKGRTFFRNIYLTGFSGAGKTFVGEKFANKIKFNFLDIDYQIEKQYNMSIKQIFEKYGEAKFRALETEMLDKCSKESNVVIALGAGAICNSTNQKIINANNGYIIYLYSDLETSINRIDLSTHPMISNISTVRLEELFCKRKYIYFDNSDLVTTGANLCHI